MPSPAIILFIAVPLVALLMAPTAVEIVYALKANAYVHFSNIPFFADTIVVTMCDESGSPCYMKPWRTPIYKFVNEHTMKIPISNVMKGENVELCVKSIEHFPGQVACSTQKLDNTAATLDYYFDYDKVFVR